MHQKLGKQSIATSLAASSVTSKTQNHTLLILIRNPCATSFVLPILKVRLDIRNNFVECLINSYPVFCGNISKGRRVKMENYRERCITVRQRPSFN